MVKLFKQLLQFDKYVAPKTISFFFWLGVVTSLLSGTVLLFSGLNNWTTSDILLGLILLIVGPIFTRLYCEIIMIAFDAIRKIFSFIK